MENSFFPLLLTGMLILFTLISIVLLIFSSNNTQRDIENASKEELLKYRTRRIAIANKAVLEYLILNKEKADLKILPIDRKPIVEKHHVRVVDLGERRRIKRQRTKIDVQL